MVGRTNHCKMKASQPFNFGMTGPEAPRPSCRKAYLAPAAHLSGHHTVECKQGCIYPKGRLHATLYIRPMRHKTLLKIAWAGRKLC